MKKSIVVTEQQLRDFKGRVLKEAFAVNTALVRKVYDYVSQNYKYAKYDDIDENGDVVEKIAIQVLASGEPIETISPQKMLDKMVEKFYGIIKDDTEQRNFLRQVLADWVDGKVTKEGMLSVNSTGV